MSSVRLNTICPLLATVGLLPRLSYTSCSSTPAAGAGGAGASVGFSCVPMAGPCTWPQRQEPVLLGCVVPV